MPSLSVCIDDFGADVKEAFDLARNLQFNAVDVSAVQGSISPRELSHTGRRHLLKHLADLGLRLGSLRGPVGGTGYNDPRGGEQRLDAMRNIIRLAADLRVPVVSTSLGCSLNDDASSDPSRLYETLCILANDADQSGVTIAIENSGLPAKTIQTLLSQVNCPLLAACCDSGTMLMQGEDPHHIADVLPGRIRLVRARDGTLGSKDALGHETTMGQGSLDIPRFLASLAEAGFNNDIVMTRTSGDRHAADIAVARDVFFRHLRL